MTQKQKLGQPYKLTPSRRRAIENSSWPWNGRMYVSPADFAKMQFEREK